MVFCVRTGRDRRSALGAVKWHLAYLFLAMTILAACQHGAGGGGPHTPFDRPAFLDTAQFVGSEQCVGCHPRVADQYRETLHGVVSGAETINQAACEACHGPGSEHAESKSADSILNLATAPADLANSYCLSCHVKLKHRATWKMRKVRNYDLRCTDCHTLHQPRSQGALLKSEPELCYDCHQHIRQSFLLPSHHPVKEGHLTCTDCHQLTVQEVRLDQREEVPNGSCFSCHAAYRGPYIFEHPPVVEDCSICHDPHGSVADSLLRQSEPFLCLQCHQMHFQSAMQGIDGQFTVSDTDRRGGVSTNDGFKSAMLTSCTVCHPQIHGSNLPSQSISGRGKTFGR